MNTTAHLPATAPRRKTYMVTWLSHVAGGCIAPRARKGFAVKADAERFAGSIAPALQPHVVLVHERDDD